MLFSTGTELPEEASELTQENVMLTGLGQGSMFGAEPLGAEEVAGGAGGQAGGGGDGYGGAGARAGATVGGGSGPPAGRLER